MTDDEARKARAAQRLARGDAWPIRRFALGTEPPVDELDTRSLDERVASVLELSRRAYALTGKPWPSYTRATMPGRLFKRPRDGR